MRLRLAAPLLFLLFAAEVSAQSPIPRVQAIPFPDHEVSFERDGREIARMHFSPDLHRPFVFPLIGPSGHRLTRMGHPGDPHTHSHHNSVWFSLSNVNGTDFWSDDGEGRIRHRYTEVLEDGNEGAFAVTHAEWLDKNGKVLLRERRHTGVKLLGDSEWLLVFELTLEAAGAPVEIAKGSFGPIGVRVAKWMGVHHGGGTLRNSDGKIGEAAVFRTPARWVDYAGRVSEGTVEGLTLMDHPANPRHPQSFHVREDGWMGAMLTVDESLAIAPDSPLVLRYGIYVHRGAPTPEVIDRIWNRFATEPVRPSFGPPTSAAECRHGDFRRYTVPHSFPSQIACESYVKQR